MKILYRITMAKFAYHIVHENIKGAILLAETLCRSQHKDCEDPVASFTSCEMLHEIDAMQGDNY